MPAPVATARKIARYSSKIKALLVKTGIVAEESCTEKARLNRKYTECYEQLMEAVQVLSSFVGRPEFSERLAALKPMIKACDRSRDELDEHVRQHKC